MLKRPVALYSGKLKELQAGDSLFGYLKAWTVKTADYTLVNGDRVMVNTTVAPRTMTLPATPAFNEVVSVKDYSGTFGTNNCTIARNGELIDGAAADKVLNTNGQAVELTYSGATYGWLTTTKV